MSSYIPTVGIEVHCELKTNTKIFSNSVNGYGQMANALTNVVDLGYPGTLPTLNKEVLNLAIKAALILNCKIRPKMHFDRKNYFYPDNPKNYQITQAETPIGYDGYVEIEVNGKKKKIEIEEMHIEEDTCKSTHRGTKTLLDFNRAGVPLIEIVTKPCMESGEEAKLYLEKLRELLFYSDVSDCKIEEGSMRADANVSIRKEVSDPYGTKAEIKNIGSISNVKLSIDKEIERQSKLYDKGETFLPQTRRFDSKLNDTVLMRVKETGNDYRYFPDPDLVAIKLSEEYIENIKKSLPELPESRKQRYLEEYKLSEKDANIITSSKYLSDLFEGATKICNNPKAVNNWIISDISRILNETEMEPIEIPFDSKQLAKLVMLIDKGTISSSIAKKVLVEMFEHPRDPEDIIDEKGWVQISDEGAIKDLVLKILEANPQSVADYKGGKDRALGYLVGQAMKETRGKANPQMLNKMFLEELKK